MHGDATLERPPTLILVAGPPTCAAPALGGTAPDAPTPAAALDAPTIVAPAVDAPAAEAPAVDPPQLRCAICHDGLAAGGVRRCPGCRTLTHAECLAELGRAGCATLGCSGRRASPVHPAPSARPASPLHRRSAWLLAPAIFTLLATGCVTGVAGVIAAWLNRGRHAEPISVLVALAFAAVHLLILPGAWCAALRGRGFADGVRSIWTYAILIIPPLALVLGLARDEDVKGLAALAGLAEPLLATLIVGGLAAAGRRRSPAPQAPRVRVRARPLAFATA